MIEEYEEGSVPKKRIRKKIEELKKEIKYYYDMDVQAKYHVEDKNLAKIAVLEEILNDRTKS